MSPFAIAGVSFFVILIVLMLWDEYKKKRTDKIRAHRRQADAEVEAKPKLIGYDPLPAKGTVEAPATWPFPDRLKPDTRPAQARKAPARTSSSVTVKRRQIEDPVVNRKQQANDNTYVNYTEVPTPAPAPAPVFSDHSHSHSHRHSELCSTSNHTHTHSHSSYESSHSHSHHDSGGSSYSGDSGGGGGCGGD